MSWMFRLVMVLPRPSRVPVNGVPTKPEAPKRAGAAIWLPFSVPLAVTEVARA